MISGILVQTPAISLCAIYMRHVLADGHQWVTGGSITQSSKKQIKDKIRSTKHDDNICYTNREGHRLEKLMLAQSRIAADVLVGGGAMCWPSGTTSKPPWPRSAGSVDVSSRLDDRSASFSSRSPTGSTEGVWPRRKDGGVTRLLKRNCGGKNSIR